MALGMVLALLFTLSGAATPLVTGAPEQDEPAPVANAEAVPGRPEDRDSLVGGNVIEAHETVQDVLCFFCQNVVRGTVRGDAVSLWGGLEVEGEILGDAVAVGGGIRVVGDGSIGGDAVALGGPVQSPPGRLSVEPTVILGLHFPGQREVFAIPAGIFLALHLLLALGAGQLLGERRLLHLWAVFRWGPVRTLLYGLLVVAAFITILSVRGVIGMGLETVSAIGGSLVMVGAMALGLPVFALALGRRFRPGVGWRWAVLAGTLVIALVSLVPLLGFLVNAALWCGVCGIAVRAFTLRKVVGSLRRPTGAEDVLGYYALGLEKDRLDEAYFPLERARTQELILRHLPPPEDPIVDVGGAAGAYAFWLAERGHEVHLVDPAPLHVEQARATDRDRGTGRLASARVGDARSLDFADGSASAVLMLGPLYHLTERDERRAALDEARRVLRPGGWLFAAAISRFASLLDGLRGPLFVDDAFVGIVERDLVDGQHRNDTGDPFYFTTAFFHHPGELSAEVREAGFTLAGLYAVEGPGAFIPGFAERWGDPKSRERLLDLLRRVEREPALLGASPHLLAVGQKTEQG